MSVFIVDPIDTLFFRDSQPFNQGEGGNSVAASLFPPLPTTIVGAIRAALARGHGWPGGPWTPDIVRVLDIGDDNKPGPLKFAGPFVWLSGAPVFPMPLHVLGKRGEKGWSDLTRLRPDKSYSCDPDAISSARLPIPEKNIDGLKNIDDVWVTKEGFDAILKGGVPKPEHLIEADQMWHAEPRTGIARDWETRTAKEGMLYTTRHVRLARNVKLAMQVEGVPVGWVPKNPTVTGGESRMTSIEDDEAISDVALPNAPTLHPGSDGLLRYTATLITPAYLDKAALTPGGSLDQLSGTIVSACIAKPIRIGGWDTEANSPLPLRSLFPAGCTWFMQTDKNDVNIIEGKHRKHRKHIGKRGEWGYGQILIGTWKEQA